LRSIRNPTLLIAAADDLLVPWQLSELIAQEIAHARLVKLDHGGHHFPHTQVETYNTLLFDFFRAHAERDAQARG
jgi:aminoacrylate hydrolase